MKDNHNSINLRRRQLLQAMAGSGISRALMGSVPLISGLLHARQADAAGVGMPDKSLVIFIPGGGIRDLWAPSGAGASMTLPVMSSGLEAVKSECNFLLNMAHGSAGHGRMPLVLSPGYSGSGYDSYDVFMGKALGPDMPFSYINLGVHSNGAGNGYITRDGNTNIPFQDNPFTAFNLLFGDNSSGSQQTPILDAHVEATNVIRSQLAGYEVQRLDEHLQAISDTQRRLDDLAGGVSCGTAPDATEFELSHDTFSQQARLQVDIAVAALKCSLTRSVSIGFGNSQCEFRIPELSWQGSYHQSIHGGSGGLPNYPNYSAMRAQLSSFTGYAVQRLAEAGILDSTVLVETTDMGHADVHGGVDAPLMLAGGGGVFQRGVTTETDGNYDHRDMLYTAAKACGVELGFGQEVPGVLV